jgi:hypothetical protein
MNLAQVLLHSHFQVVSAAAQISFQNSSHCTACANTNERLNNPGTRIALYPACTKTCRLCEGEAPMIPVKCHFCGNLIQSEDGPFLCQECCTLALLARMRKRQKRKKKLKTGPSEGEVDPEYIDLWEGEVKLEAAVAQPSPDSQDDPCFLDFLT